MPQRTEIQDRHPVETVGRLVLAAAAVLALWIVYVASRLPADHETHHWMLLWTGFDVGVGASLVASGLAAVRRRSWLGEAAAVTATLLVADAWFDVVTAGGGRALVVAALEATFAELPAAAVCLWLVVASRRRGAADAGRPPASVVVLGGRTRQPRGGARRLTSAATAASTDGSLRPAAGPSMCR